MCIGKRTTETLTNVSLADVEPCRAISLVAALVVVVLAVAAVSLATTVARATK
jgi:hypothetical protein